jgi:hypothetical protein
MIAFQIYSLLLGLLMILGSPLGCLKNVRITSMVLGLIFTAAAGLLLYWKSGRSAPGQFGTIATAAIATISSLAVGIFSEMNGKGCSSTSHIITKLQWAIPACAIAVFIVFKVLEKRADRINPPSGRAYQDMQTGQWHEGTQTRYWRPA